MNATVETLYLADLNELFRAPEPIPSTVAPSPSPA